MHLYFLRHGIAEDPDWGQPDSTRRLTPEGIALMEQEARGMAKLGLRFDALYSSPYPRALKTAEIVASALAAPPVIIAPDMAAGSFHLGVLQSLVESHSRKSRLLFTGHEPDLSGMVSQLCGATLVMKKGGLACIEANRPEPRAGVLLFFLTPAQLASLGEG